MRRRSHRPSFGGGEVALNVIPLIDVVFFLLVFYVIASTFLKEEAVAVERPASSQAAATSGAWVAVAVDRGGAVTVGDRVVELTSLPAAVGEALRGSEARRVVLIADRSVTTGRLLAVMDACTAGGAEHVDVAATAGLP